MDVTLGRKTIDSLGAKLEQLSEKLDKDEKLLLNSVLELAAREVPGNVSHRPAELLRRVKGKFELASVNVIM